MKWLDSALEKLGLKKPEPGNSYRIESEDGERTAGHMYVTVGLYDENGESVPGTSRQIALLIPRRLRKTCNRMLDGSATEDDREVFQSWVLQNLNN